jgi:cytochrome c biogenesis protein CcmG, thiol:disulfide interchange protein DsbE
MAMRLSAVLPIVVFAALGGALALGLTHDPKTIPSMLIDRQVPEFKLPPLIPNQPALDSTKLPDRGLVLINVFSSWCSGCRLEHPYLMEKTKDKRFLLVGLNWKDDADNARNFIATYGNPFAEIGADPSGRVGIDLGVTGAAPRSGSHDPRDLEDRD